MAVVSLCELRGLGGPITRLMMRHARVLGYSIIQLSVIIGQDTAQSRCVSPSVLFLTYIRQLSIIIGQERAQSQCVSPPVLFLTYIRPIYLPFHLSFRGIYHTYVMCVAGGG